MHDEGDGNEMQIINWVVAGTNSMEIHGYAEGDNPRQPTVKVLTTGSGEWSFTFRDMQGTGRIQVGKGGDYNPLDLIESLYHHMTSSVATINKGQSNPKTAQVKMTDRVDFEHAFGDEWI